MVGGCRGVVCVWVVCDGGVEDGSGGGAVVAVCAACVRCVCVCVCVKCVVGGAPFGAVALRHVKSPQWWPNPSCDGRVVTSAVRQSQLGFGHH